MIRNLDLSLFVFFWAFFWFLSSIIIYKFDKAKKNLKYEKQNKDIIKFSVFQWVIHFFAFYFFIKALEWNLAVVYTINSFSILIPIILSIIFFKEHFSFKKAFVIVLSIISIILFI